ncbi:type II secretion system protein N [Rhizorhabdus sp.]|uniref:type II secretion system protein N n=1 Tax=Rhizorhabdus sp. TaxID=1968843 RepID=UPI00199FB57D|nr:type II secretion system protein N [Rhizorhabdus sp.]MBD3760341.1 type II secretion system protein N [Rhizorhabdus sp.]
MKTILLFLIGVAMVICAIPLIPLETAVNLFQLRRVGFEASQIQGNIWEGQMYDARLAKIELGDVMSKMSLDDISKGRVRLNIEGTNEVSRLQGGFSFGLGGPGVEQFTVGMPLVAGPPPIGGVTLILDGLTARFPGGECTDGRGEVRAYLSGALPAVGLPSEMSGPALCRDGKLTFDLASPSGREQETVTILAPNKFKVRMFIKPSMERVEQILQSKGFQRLDDGYVFEEERTI